MCLRLSCRVFAHVLACWSYPMMYPSVRLCPMALAAFLPLEQLRPRPLIIVEFVDFMCFSVSFVLASICVWWDHTSVHTCMWIMIIILHHTAVNCAMLLTVTLSLGTWQSCSVVSSIVNGWTAMHAVISEFEYHTNCCPCSNPSPKTNVLQPAVWDCPVNKLLTPKWNNGMISHLLNLMPVPVLILGKCRINRIYKLSKLTWISMGGSLYSSL